MHPRATPCSAPGAHDLATKTTPTAISAIPVSRAGPMDSWSAMLPYEAVSTNPRLTNGYAKLTSDLASTNNHRTVLTPYSANPTNTGVAKSAREMKVEALLDASNARSGALETPNFSEICAAAVSATHNNAIAIVVPRFI